MRIIEEYNVERSSQWKELKKTLSKYLKSSEIKDMYRVLKFEDGAELFISSDAMMAVLPKSITNVNEIVPYFTNIANAEKVLIYPNDKTKLSLYKVELRENLSYEKLFEQSFEPFRLFKIVRDATLCSDLLYKLSLEPVLELENFGIRVSQLAPCLLRFKLMSHVARSIEKILLAYRRRDAVEYEGLLVIVFPSFTYIHTFVFEPF